MVSQRPPAVLLGGNSNALAVARALKRKGVQVFALNYSDSHIRHSNAARYITLDYGERPIKAWADYLLGSSRDHLRGAVLFPLTDEAIEFVAKHHEALSERYLMEPVAPSIRTLLLDKFSTYDAAQAAGVATPWYLSEPADLESIAPELRYPLIVKPNLSHEFRRHFAGGRKYIRVDRPQDLAPALATVARHNLDVGLMEFIEGPDDQLCSYYTYLDEKGEPLFQFTKRVIRRYPYNMGPGTYHVTDHIPEASDVGLKFFQAIGLQGLGNVEFKLDRRDGRLKLIECNARFTEGTALAVRAGSNQPLLVYNRLIGESLPDINEYRSGVHLLDPMRDRWACKDFPANGPGNAAWLAALLRCPVFPYFELRDPLPTLAKFHRTLQKRWSKS